jgi:hypothetical protein
MYAAVDEANSGSFTMMLRVSLGASEVFDSLAAEQYWSDSPRGDCRSQSLNQAHAWRTRK